MEARKLDNHIQAVTRIYLYCAGFYRGDGEELGDDIAKLELLCSIASQMLRRRLGEVDE